MFVCTSTLWMTSFTDSIITDTLLTKNKKIKINKSRNLGQVQSVVPFDSMSIILKAASLTDLHFQHHGEHHMLQLCNTHCC